MCPQAHFSWSDGRDPLVELIGVEAEWMPHGKCRDMDPSFFFPNDGMGVLAAQRVCAECPVRTPCLEYALVNRIDHGVWGGASERERRRILRQRRLARVQLSGHN